MHYDYGRSLLWHFFFCCSYSTTSLGKGLYYYLVLNAQQCPCWWRDQMMVRKKDTFWIIFLLVFSLHYVKHTIRNVPLMSKIQYWDNHNCWTVELKYNVVWEFLNVRFFWIIWVFAPKILILCNCKIINDWILQNFDNF